MPTVRRADALSRDTEYSGLPKSIRMECLIAQGPSTAGTWYAIVWSQSNPVNQAGSYNHGGFKVQGGGVVGINEPGVYDIMCCMNISVPAESYLGWIWTGSGGGANPTIKAGQASAYSPSFPARQCYGSTLHMQEGDTILPVWFQVGVGVNIAGDGSSFYTVSKRPGQY